MIKNIIFDIGGVINNWEINDLISHFTNNDDEKKLLLDYVYNAPEWAKEGLFDKGLITHDEFSLKVQERTNHVNDELIHNFIMNYYKFFYINPKVCDLMMDLKEKGYKVYVLSNISDYIISKMNCHELFLDKIDGYVLSYIEQEIKPYENIYDILLSRYNLIPEESLFIDDMEENVVTANKLGIKGRKVIRNSYEDIINILKEYKVIE